MVALSVRSKQENAREISFPNLLIKLASLQKAAEGLRNNAGF